MKKTLVFTFLFMIITSTAFAATHVTILNIHGDVRIRKGIEENWSKAKQGMILEDIDSIMTGKRASVVLRVDAKQSFTLQENAMLDILDLRAISEQELFLFIMEQKLKKVEPASPKTKLRIGNVSVVHGELKADVQKVDQVHSDDLWVQEKNGAISLYHQDYLTNSIMKMYRILDNYNDIEDCGEMHLYLGKAFESLHKTGQAIDSYRISIDRSSTGTCDTTEQLRIKNQSREALKRLSNK